MEFENMINTIQLGDSYEIIKQIPDKSFLENIASFCESSLYISL